MILPVTFRHVARCEFEEAADWYERMDPSPQRLVSISAATQTIGP